MLFVRNPVDGCKVYFEDDGGDGSPVVILNGLGDPIAASRRWGVSQALAVSHRLIYVDHRGHGGSDKPHQVTSYAMPLRVADVVAVLDEMGIEHAHFIGASWGARLLFGLGDRAPERVLSLTMGGQSPYAMNPDSRGVRMVTQAFARGRRKRDFVEALGGFGDIDEETRRWTLDNDFKALAAAWNAAMAEGDVAPGLAGWRIPCLIYAGTRDRDFYEPARRAASEIPGATFVALEGLSHLEAHENVDDVLPHIKALIDGAGR
jgi:pimeloyl-ACP methyl ester carboxylesterase